MKLSRPDAASILRFCLGADDSGRVSEREDGTCTITIALCRASTDVNVFEGATFEEALGNAVSAGVLKAACVDKQRAFLRRRAAEAGPEGAALQRDASADSLGRFAAVAEAVAALLHETQLERGISALRLAGRERGDDLAAQWRRTDQQRLAFFTVIDAVLRTAPAGAQRRMEQAQTLLAALGTTRGCVQDQAVRAGRMIDLYSAVNAELLGLLDAFMVTGLFGPRRASALVCVCLLYAKEKAALEQAQLADAFGAGRFVPGQRSAIVALMAAQASYLHVFSAGAPEASAARLRELLSSPVATRIKRMEEVVYADGEQGFGIDANSWFGAMAQKIDGLADLSHATITMLRDPRPPPGTISHL